MQTKNSHLESQPEMNFPKKWSSKIFKNEKSAKFFGAVLMVFAACALLYAFSGQLFRTSNDIEFQLHAISAEQVVARIEKSNFLAQKMTAEKLLAEANSGLEVVDQKILILREKEMRLAEQRAIAISTDSLGQ